MYWKLALAQHPMYLLIKEDTGCAERTPPWGTPDIGQYIDRLRQNITTLHRYPQVKIGYEWSGLELEQLKDDAPEVLEAMVERVVAGQSTFYNGTYAQPHLQTLSSEANYRQFEWGTRVYRQICPDHPVQVYAHQETSVNEQTPQLLKAFGINFATLPHSSATLVVLDGGELLFQWSHGTMFMHGEEFAHWRGLDGTQVDLYLDEPAHDRLPDWLAYQEMVGLTHVPPLMISMPDMIAVDEAWMAERSRANFVLLEPALEERRKAYPPRFEVRFFSNWSYIEGIRAEELSRQNWKAEVGALRAEALNSLAFALVQRVPESTDLIWKQILGTQHHDVYCFGAPELREKSIASLGRAIAAASQLSEHAALAVASRVDTSTVNGQPMVVFNTVPHAQTGVVEVDLDLPAPAVLDMDGRRIPSEALALPDGRTRVRFLGRLPGLGYTTLQFSSQSVARLDEMVEDLFTFENGFYRAAVRPDGSFSSLGLCSSGEELLTGDEAPGNQLAACDSTGLGTKHEGTLEVGWERWVKWDPPQRGPELAWQQTRSAQLCTSELGVTFLTAGRMGAAVEAELQIHFYHDMPRIDLDWTFTFDGASIGSFFDDDTKLRVLWPLSFRGAIAHDIAFGVVNARADRPLLPASWVDISDGNKGFGYFHQGTPKHWVTGNTLVNLLAWGEDTDAIGSRLARVRWPKCFDQRLRGTQAIHTAIYPHEGDWRAADLIGAARSFQAPPIAYETGRHAGVLPPKMDILRLAGEDLTATAVTAADGQVTCRFYSFGQEKKAVTVETDRLKRVGLATLAGDPIDEIGPFQIGTLSFQSDIL